MIAAGLLLPACTLPNNDVDRLPDPATPLCPPGLARNDAEQARLDERDQFLYDEYVTLWGEDAIVVTKQTPQCAIIDCISLDRINEPWVEPPPPITPEQLQLPDGVQLQLTELDVFPELQCPANTMVVDRPSFSAYVWGDTGATSLQDWLDNYPEVVGAPGGSASDTAKHVYAGHRQTVTNVGANVWVISYSGEIERDTLSAHEVLVECLEPEAPQQPETPQQLPQHQWVGAGNVRDYLNKYDGGNNGDTVLRIFVEFITQDPSLPGSLGPRKGGIHGIRSRTDFKFIGWRKYGPNATLYPGTISTVGGTQYASRYTIELLGDKWWVAHNDNWLGYYDSSLFTKADPDDKRMTSHACRVQIFGEVAAKKEKATTTTTDMGSPEFAEAGFGNAAGFINPYYRDTALSYWPLDPSQAQPASVSGYKPACYTNTPLTPGAGTTILFCFASGPGWSLVTSDCQW